jgi:uncharacterized protein (TIGR01777 family)
MKILLTGASGLVGRALSYSLNTEGHDVVRLVRPGHALGPGDASWSPETAELDAARATGADAAVNLAGASIAQARWSAARKALLRSSRVDYTRSLLQALARLPQPPKVFISASAVGYFGDRGDEVLTDQSAPGNDFLARLARDWEEEALRAQEFGMRVVVLRFGVVLSSVGGALKRMLLPFRVGLGGRLGPGKQWLSWLTLPEAVRMIRHGMENSSWQGAFNATSPNPVTNAEFTRELARVLRRPAVFPAPAFMLRLALGELADGLLLASQRAIPRRLLELRYSFQHPNLAEALTAVLSQPQ